MKKNIQNLGRIKTAEIKAISADQLTVLADVYGEGVRIIDVLDEKGVKTGEAEEVYSFEDRDISFAVEHVVQLSETEIEELPTIEDFINR